jgi:hypothetical protein
MRTHAIAFLFVLTAVCGLKAQVPQPNPTLSPGASNTWNLDWEGVYGRGYFLQHSDDLVNWQYFPLMEMGWGSTIPYGFASSAERFFVRLRYTDDTNDFYWGDYDDDGITNWEEIHTHGIDPFNADTDGDGVPDGAELGASTDPNDDQSAPDFWWQRTTRDLQYDFDDYEPPYNTGILARNAIWDSSLNSTEQLSAAIPFPDLKGRLQELTFPSTLSATQGASGLTPSEGYSSLLPNPPCYHATLNHQRHWLRTGTAWPDQYKKTVIVLTERTIDGVEQTPEVDTEDVVIPANQLVSEPFDLESGFVQNFTGNEYHSEQVTKTPLTVAIEPDDNQPGNTGDLIPSNKGAVGEEHYVSPKKSTEIPDDYVVLKATAIAQGRFEELLEWDGGEAHPTDSMKRRVKRDTAAKTVVKIKVKQGGAEVAKMNVWVVWAIAQPRVGTIKPLPDPDWFEYRIGIEEDKNWRFKFTIEPAGIITEADRPALHGNADLQKNVPGHNKPYPTDPDPNLKADTAVNKWDVTRQMSISLRNPGLITKAQLEEHFLGQWTDGQPQNLHTPVPYPTNPVEGNDDPFTVDEENNPYAVSNQMGLEHQIGEITSFDAPGWSVLNSWGTANDQEFVAMSNFREFARVQLWDGKRANGKFWFRISNYGLWHHSLKAKFDLPTGKWNDNGSSSALGNIAP